MSSVSKHRDSRAAFDHADIVLFRTSSNARVELMRTSYRTQVFPRHTHDYYTLGVVLQGTGTLWCRGADHIRNPGDVVVIPPGEVHTGGLAPGSSMLSYLAVHIPEEVLIECAEAHGALGGRSPDFSFVSLRDPAISDQLCRLDALMREISGSAGRINAEAVDDALGSAIRLLVSRHGDAPQLHRHPEQVRESRVVRIAREILDDCFGDNTHTSLQSLALRTGVTPSHLVRVFTQAIGLSPHRYLVQTRVQRAKELLARGTPSSLVAAMTGFVDQSHLTTQFRRYVGVTPAFYQQCVRFDSRLME